MGSGGALLAFVILAIWRPGLLTPLTLRCGRRHTDRDRDLRDTILAVSHSIVQPGDLPFVERPYRPQDEPRQVARLTEALGLENARASVWRYPPGARGRRHREGAQEEVFAVLDGTITLALGEPPEMVEIAAGGFARVGTDTEIQVRNERSADALLLVWGAPAVTGQAEILDDLP